MVTGSLLLPLFHTLKTEILEPKDGDLPIIRHEESDVGEIPK